MKKLLILVGVMLMIANVAPAQVDPDQDGLGIYFDTAGTVRCESGIMPGLKSVYLIASNISCATLAGWEARVYCDNPMWMFLSATLAGTGPINLFAPPIFQVGLGVPMERTPAMLLVTLQYFVQDLNPTPFRIGLIQYPSIPGEPACYADGADVGHLVPFVSPQADWSLPVAYGNSLDCNIVPVTNDTWGGVKGMFK